MGGGEGEGGGGRGEGGRGERGRDGGRGGGERGGRGGGTVDWVTDKQRDGRDFTWIVATLKLLHSS